MRRAREWDREATWSLLACAVLFGLLLLDVFTPRSFATGVLYLPVVLLSSLSGRIRTVVAVAAVSAGFVVLGLFLSPVGPHDDTVAIVATRAASVLALGLCAWIATALLRSQARATRSQHRLRLLADSLPVLVWTTCPDGGIDYFSRGLADYTGATPEQVLGDAWVGLLHPDDRERALAHWTRSVSTEGPYHVEFRIRRHDGEHRWHLTSATPERDDAGTLVRWWGSCIDIDDRRTFEQQAHDLAGRLTWTLESVSDAILGLDTDWRVTVMNENAATLLLRSRDSLMGQVVWDQFPEAVGSIFQTEYERAVAEGTPVRFEAAYPPIGKHLEISAYPHARGLTIYFRDITENLELAEQLAHAQRLDSLGQLTGGVAHDFNNLLTVILGSSEVLTRRLADEPDLLRLAAGIEAAAHRGASLTHSLLAFARKQPLNPTVVDVNTLVRETEKLLVHTLGRPVTITTVLADGAGPCLVDNGQLGNALLNLCLNARDAMPGGGRLLVETAEVYLDGRYPDVAPGPYVTLTVSDDGRGMTPDVVDRVFEPFFTTKGPGEGSGLGLAMVYGFARQSHGHVTVSSRPGSGTTVRLYLPMATTPVAGGAAR